MKTISNSAEKTLLEMISRYKISRRAKLGSGELNSWEIADSMPALGTVVFSTLSCFIISLIGMGLNKQLGEGLTFTLIVMTLLIAIVLLVKSLVDDHFDSLKKVFNFYLRERIERAYYKLRRKIKIKKNISFERELRENYAEIKSWCVENGILRELKELVSEMQFPSESDYPISTKMIIELVNESKLKIENYNPHFVGLDELRSIGLEEKNKSLFFAGNS